MLGDDVELQDESRLQDVRRSFSFAGGGFWSGAASGKSGDEGLPSEMMDPEQVLAVARPSSLKDTLPGDAGKFAVT